MRTDYEWVMDVRGSGSRGLPPGSPLRNAPSRVLSTNTDVSGWREAGWVQKSPQVGAKSAAEHHTRTSFKHISCFCHE